MGFVCSLVAVVIFLFTGVFSHLSAIYGKLECLNLGVQNCQVIPNLSWHYWKKAWWIGICKYRSFLQRFCKRYNRKSTSSIVAQWREAAFLYDDMSFTKLVSVASGWDALTWIVKRGACSSLGHAAGTLRYTLRALDIHSLQFYWYIKLYFFIFFEVVIFILYMAYKSNARKEDEDIDEGFEDLSSSALHDIHYGHINQGFNGAASADGDDLHPVSSRKTYQTLRVFGVREWHLGPHHFIRV